MASPSATQPGHGALQNRVAVITGAGRGIGRAVANEFAAAGAWLTLASRTQSELDRVAEECRARGAECVTCTADVSRYADVEQLVGVALKAFGRIDVLANVAGIYGPIGPIVETDPAEWERALQVNLMGTFNTCRAVLPTMIAQRSGRIVNLSGGGAASPLPRFSAYGVSKAGVVRLTETLAEEVKEHGITVNAIAPGAIDTSLQDEVLAAGEKAGDLYGRMKALRESGKGGTPIEVPVRLALFLASDASRGLTGRLVAAPHDGWEKWDDARIDSLDGTPWFTLRRLDPFTIGPLQNSAP